jgi:hypothetical protein
MDKVAQSGETSYAPRGPFAIQWALRDARVGELNVEPEKFIKTKRPNYCAGPLFPVPEAHL